MITNYQCIICDFCTAAIDYYECSKSLANKLAKDNGVVIKGKLHFCSNDCYKKFRGVER